MCARAHVSLFWGYARPLVGSAVCHVMLTNGQHSNLFVAERQRSKMEERIKEVKAGGGESRKGEKS